MVAGAKYESLKWTWGFQKKGKSNIPSDWESVPRISNSLFRFT